MRALRISLRWLFLLMLFTLTCAAQSVAGARMGISGGQPDLLPALLVCAAVREGAAAGGMLGLFSALLMGAGGDLLLLLSPLCFAVGRAAGRLAETRLRVNLLSVWLLSVPASILFTLSRALLSRMAGGPTAPSAALSDCGAGIAVSLAAVLIFHPLLAGLHRLTAPRGRRSL